MGATRDYFDEYRCGRADIDAAETSIFRTHRQAIRTMSAKSCSLERRIWSLCKRFERTRRQQMSAERRELPLLLHIALVRLPPTPKKMVMMKKNHTDKRQAGNCLGLGGGIGFGGGIGGINRFGVGLGVVARGRARRYQHCRARPFLCRRRSGDHVAFGIRDFSFKRKK